MTDVSDGQWRWPLPDDWEPEGYWCVCITIPADQQYFDRLTGALGLLTLSKSWFPDATRQGPKTVAETWERALYLNMFQLSETCYPVASPPIPDDAAADDAAAAIYTVFFQHIVSELNTLAPTSGDCPDAVDTVMEELTPYGASDAVRGTLQRLCSDLNANPDARGDFETDCVFKAQKEDLRDKIRNQPQDWLNHLADWMFGYLDTVLDPIYNDLNTLAGLLGMGTQGFVNDHGGIPPGGGADFGSTCLWSVDLDMHSQDWGFVPSTEGGTWDQAGGFWLSAFGWLSSEVTRLSGTDHATLLSLEMTLDPTVHLTNIVATYTLTKGQLDDTENNNLYTPEGGASEVEVNSLSDGENTLTYTHAPVDASLIAVHLVASRVYGGGNSNGQAILTNLHLEGYGPQPWF